MKQWLGRDKQGNIIYESNCSWKNAKDNLSALSFDNNGQTIMLPENLSYVQGKSASANIGSGEVTVESRFIGFLLGNNIVKIRIDEKSNNIRIEIENASPAEKPGN